MQTTQKCVYCGTTEAVNFTSLVGDGEPVCEECVARDAEYAEESAEYLGEYA